MLMNTAGVTVSMPIEHYEQLRAIEQAFNDDCRMFEEAYKQNEEGKGMLTEKLKQRISEIYC